MASVLGRWVRPPLVSVLVLGLIAAGVWGFGYRESIGTPEGLDHRFVAPLPRAGVHVKTVPRFNIRHERRAV